MRRLTLPLTVVLLCAPALAQSWGYAAHALIGELAQRQLDDRTQTEALALLIDEPEPGLAAIASWADQVRNEEGWRWTAPMHYVNFADAGCDRVLPADCLDGRCIQAAIERYRDDLADRHLSRRQRAEALKFLVHFVGDAHQPLHAGHRDDRGGNDFQLDIDGEGSNLHAVWDFRVPGIERDAIAAQADRLMPHLPIAEANGDPWQWTRESCALIDRIGLYPDRPGRLPPDYLERMRPHAEARIVLAAARLAAMLEDALRTADP